MRFSGVDSSTTLGRVEGSPTFIRTGANKIVVDVDGDGTGDLDVPTKGRLEAVELEIGQGATRRKWAFFAQVGSDSDQYQGIQLSNAASDSSWIVYIAPGGSMTSTIRLATLEVFDDNMDGIYGSPPLTYGHVGLTNGLFQPEFDTVVVDGAKRAQPWSEYVNTKAGWLKVEMKNDGARISATPVQLKTGKLKLVAKGVKPAFLVVQGTHDFERSFFDVAAGKEVEVPVGRYLIYCGMIAKGKKKQLLKALVLPGEAARTYDVTEGETVEVLFGAPYDFVFDYSTSAETISIEGPLGGHHRRRRRAL